MIELMFFVDFLKVLQKNEGRIQINANIENIIATGDDECLVLRKINLGKLNTKISVFIHLIVRQFD